MKLERKLKELVTYENALQVHYPNLTEFERLQIAVSLMNCETKEQVHEYLTKI